MTALPPEGPLWQAVRARVPDLWPVDSEVVAADLATALDGVADSVEAALGRTAHAAGTTGAAWGDTSGGLMTTGLGRQAARMADTAAHVRQRSAGARAYATEITGAKTDIRTTVEANEPVFALLDGLPAPWGPPLREGFADLVAADLSAAVDRRVAAVSALRLPTPPTHEQLLSDPGYQVDDDELTEYLGRTVTVEERRAIEELSLSEKVDFFHSYFQAMEGGSTVFPDVGRAGELDNHRDAYRHALWNALLTERLGEDKAAELTTLHEGVPDDEHPLDPVREAMDMHNNEVGRRIAAQAPPGTALGPLIEQAVRDGKLVVIDDHGRLVPSDYDFERPPERSDGRGRYGGGG
ncbi:DUF6973 domain-containing protein [Actinosynnema sp. NPDC091369]